MSILLMFGAAYLIDVSYHIAMKAKDKVENYINHVKERAAYNRRRYHSRVWS